MWWVAYRYGAARAAAKAADMELQMLSDANRAQLMTEAQGARWKRNPDGSWMRWSYLGEDWEAQPAPAPLLQAAEMKPGESYWMVTPTGMWTPYDPSKPPESPRIDEPKQAEQLPPAPSQPEQPPRIDPDTVPRPEWTSDWKPGWTQDFKK
jgi:hypothetical protein